MSECSVTVLLLVTFVKSKFVSALENRVRDINWGFVSFQLIMRGVHIKFKKNHKQTDRTTDMSCRMQYDGRKLVFYMQFAFSCYNTRHGVSETSARAFTTFYFRLIL